MWNLGVLTDTTLVSSFLLANTMDWKWNYRKRLTHCQRIVSWCLLDFLFCQREHKQNLLFGWKATLSHHLLYVLILIFSCSILRTSCQCQDCCVLYVWCLYQWFQQGHLALFHTGVFKIFFYVCFLWDTRVKRGTSLALWCLGNNGGESRRCPVDIWHFTFYWFVPYAALLYAWFLLFIDSLYLKIWR